MTSKKGGGGPGKFDPNFLAMFDKGGSGPATTTKEEPSKEPKKTKKFGAGRLDFLAKLEGGGTKAKSTPPPSTSVRSPKSDSSPKSPKSQKSDDSPETDQSPAPSDTTATDKAEATKSEPPAAPTSSSTASSSKPRGKKTHALAAGLNLNLGALRPGASRPQKKRDPDAPGPEMEALAMKKPQVSKKRKRRTRSMMDDEFLEVQGKEEDKFDKRWSLIVPPSGQSLVDLVDVQARVDEDDDEDEDEAKDDDTPVPEPAEEIEKAKSAPPALIVTTASERRIVPEQIASPTKREETKSPKGTQKSPRGAKAVADAFQHKTPDHMPKQPTPSSKSTKKTWGKKSSDDKATTKASPVKSTKTERKDSKGGKEEAPSSKALRDEIESLESILSEKKARLAKMQRAELSEKLESTKPIKLIQLLNDFCAQADKEQLEVLRSALSSDD